MANRTPFRCLGSTFFKDLNDKSNNLHFVLDFEKKHRRAFIVEIRDDFLDLYFLGHAIEIKKIPGEGGYRMIGANEFNPAPFPQNDSLKNIISRYGEKKWQVRFNQLRTYDEFEKILRGAMAGIVAHRRGQISEGVGEINHFVDNRDFRHSGVLVIDRQVVYPGVRKKIDLLGLRRLDSKKCAFTVIELKNRNNVKIGSAFSQTRDYIDLVYGKYSQFVDTYEKVLDQKKKLGLLGKIGIKFADHAEISKKDIMGIVILDNFNIRSDLKKNGLLKRALDDWAIDDENYCLRLFLKTNVLDENFFYDRRKAAEMLGNYLRQHE